MGGVSRMSWSSSKRVLFSLHSHACVMRGAALAQVDGSTTHCAPIQSSLRTKATVSFVCI